MLSSPTSRSSLSRRTRRDRQRRWARLERLEDRRLLAVLLDDGFESGSNSNDWSGNWVADGQNAWFRSTQRASDGSLFAAEVDGGANGATLSLADPLDLTGYSTVDVTFDWFIERSWDTNEQITLEFTNDGTLWNQVAALRGNVDAENVWHSESITLDSSYLVGNFGLRFAATVSSSREDGHVDNVQINGTQLQAEISVSDATVTEGDAGLVYIDRFVAEQGLTKPFRGLAMGPDANGDGREDLYVVSAGTDEVLRFDGTTGTPIDVFVSAGSGGLDNPVGMRFGPDGNLYVASDGVAAGPDNNILRYDGNSGAFQGIAASGLQRAISFDFGDDGDLYVGNRDTNTVDRFDGSTGAALGTFVADAAGTSGDLRQVIFGDDVNGDSTRDLYVASQGNAEILRYDASTGLLWDTITLPSSYVELLWIDVGSDGSIYASVRPGPDDSRILRLDGTTGAITAELALGRDGWSSMVDDNDIVYVSSAGIGTFVDRLGPASLATFGVTLSATQALPVTVDFLTSDDTATAGMDYAATAGTITFAPGETSKTIVIPTTDDAVVEPQEQFLAQLSNPGNATLGGANAIGTIIDNDFGNQAPIAFAGADLSIGDGDGSGDQIVTLNGSGSDADGSISSYEWTEGASVIGTTASISPTLAVGVHTLTLTVTDNGGASSSDSVVVTVIANQAPTADSGLDQNVIDSDESGSETVTLTGSGSDADGSIVAYEWKEGTTLLGSTASISPTLSVGTHTLTLRVTDNGGASSSDDVVVTVNTQPVSSTKFYVVDDSVDDMFEYQADGSLETTYSLGTGNNSPRGAAATAAGDTVWVIDNDDHVYVHDDAGNLLREWKANGLSRPEGIATDGNDVWIVDRGNDRVHYFAGGATRTTDTSATSSFALVAGNPRGITTDGVASLGRRYRYR